MVYRIMPLLLLTHLLFASWMFGSPHTLASTPVFPDFVYERFLGQVSQKYGVIEVSNTGYNIQNLTKPVLALSVEDFLSETASRVSRTTSVSHFIFFLFLLALLIFSLIGNS